MFKIKCPHCGAKNDKERITCVKCGKPFELKKTEDEFTVAPAEQIVQEKEEAEEETGEEIVLDTLQDATRATVEIEASETVKDEDLSIEDEANILDDKFKQVWVKANGRCQCIKAHHGHEIPCGKKLRVDAHKLKVEGGWEYCDLYSFPFGESDEITVPAIVCWECYHWKMDFNWDRYQSRTIT